MGYVKAAVQVLLWHVTQPPGLYGVRQLDLERQQPSWLVILRSERVQQSVRSLHFFQHRESGDSDIFLSHRPNS